MKGVLSLMSAPRPRTLDCYHFTLLLLHPVYVLHPCLLHPS